MKKNVKKLLTAIVASLIPTLVVAQVPADSPYKSDASFVFNKDDTSEAFDLIAVISCFVRNMAPEVGYNQVGSNPFVAMVDVNKCEGNEVSSSEGGVQAAPSYDTAVVLPTLDSNGVLNFRIWITGADTIDDNNDGQPDKIWVRGSITGSASKVPPFGQWEVEWCNEYSASTDSCLDFGKVSVGPDGSRGFFSFNKGNESGTLAVVGETTASKTSGGGRFSTNYVFNGNPDGKSGVYAFNSQLAFSSVTPAGGAVVDRCVIPDSSRPGTIRSPWETWLYDSATGERIDVNSGFSIRDENGRWGWAGYWGVDIGGRAVTSGQRVTRLGSNDQVLETYTGVTAPGKLRKITLTTSNLSDLKGVELRTNIPKRLLPGFTQSNEWVQAIFSWDGNNFKVTAWEDCSGQTGCELRYLGTPVSGSIADMSDESLLNVNDLHAWQNGTATSYRIIFARWVQTSGQWNRERYLTADSVRVKARRDQTVDPNSTNVPQTLFCVGRCADTALNFAEGGDSKKADVEGRPYSWNQAALTLSLDSTPIDFSSKERAYWSGALVAQSDLASITCQVWDRESQQQVDGYCEWLADDLLNEFYRWESGPGPWNRYSGLRNAETGRLETFQEPLVVSYAVPTDDPSVTYRGKTVSIQYPGNGSLWLPGYCLNKTTRERTDCSEEDTDWANEFTIPYSESVGFVTDAIDSNKRYLVKTLRQGVYYPDAPNQTSAECLLLKTQGATFANRELPSVGDWINPAAPSSPNYLGPWRSPTAPPLIIDGKLRTAD